MRSGLCWVLTLGLAVAPASVLGEDDDRTSAELAMELIQVTGRVDATHQVMRSFSVYLRPAFPSVSDELWNELIESLDHDEFAELVIPIYTKHYTREDLAGLLAFYRTPLGKRLLETNPAVMEESMAVGAAWGRKKAEEIVEELRTRGYEPIGI